MRGRSQHDRLRWGGPAVSSQQAPTEADCAASLYDVTFTYIPSGVSLSFFVLALDAEHSLEMSDIRMASTGRQVAGASVKTAPRSLETSGEAMAMALKIESEEEHACRQAAFNRQHPEREPADKLNTLGGIEFES